MDAPERDSDVIGAVEPGRAIQLRKSVQARMRHSSFVVTADVYSHLLPRHDESKELADAADALFL
jgi:integrase